MTVKALIRLLALLGLFAAPAIAAGPDLPAYAPAYEPTTVDERGMWMEADERERLLRDSPLRIREGALERYVRSVLCRTVGEERCRRVRLYLMELPAFNASMSPNGCMEIWSGLLLRLRNEAELATVLGHEFGHFELRHSLAGFKAKRATTDALAWLGVMGGVANTNVQGLQASLLGSVYRFDRDQESQADLIGLKYLAGARYPAEAAAGVWRQRMAEDDATAIGRGRKPRQSYASGFFDTHPTSLKRADTLAAAAATMPGGTGLRAAEYRAAIAPHLAGMLAAQVRLNDFGGSDFVLNTLAAEGGWTGDLLFARAELYRGRGHPRDLQMATLWYRQARVAGYAGAELDRNLGLALLRNGDGQAAREALRAYLAARPDAADAGMIRTLVEE